MMGTYGLMRDDIDTHRDLAPRYPWCLSYMAHWTCGTRRPRRSGVAKLACATP